MKRVVGASSKENYRIERGTILIFFDNELNIVMKCKDSWPTHVTFEEENS